MEESLDDRVTSKVPPRPSSKSIRKKEPHYQLLLLLSSAAAATVGNFLNFRGKERAVRGDGGKCSVYVYRDC